MSKIWAVINREYNQAVRKKSFIVVTILGPVLMAALIIVPIFLATNLESDVNIAVLDESGLFQKLNSKNDKDISFVYVDAALPELKNRLVEGEYDALLYIPDNKTMIGGVVYAASVLGSGVMSNVLSAMKANLTSEILVEEFGINQDSLDLYINRQTDKIVLGQMFINDDMSETKQASYEKDIQQTIGFVIGFIIYFFIFMYCSMVLRSVLEEKNNRVVEVIISSVRPIQLMTGKIIGIAMIGITQLVIWIVLLFSILGIFKVAFPNVFEVSNSGIEVQQQLPADYANFTANLQQQAVNQDNEFVKSLQTIDFTKIILLFVFFFITGYFLYASLFAAVGAAVDNDADTQQFLIPLTIPLILAIVVSPMVIKNPEGSLAFWFSIIPFTSPIVMLIRIPFGINAVQNWEILLSCVLILLGCFISVWVAAKIYRTGILMYGKKVSYRELWKWITYREK